MEIKITINEDGKLTIEKKLAIEGVHNFLKLHLIVPTWLSTYHKYLELKLNDGTAYRTSELTEVNSVLDFYLPQNVCTGILKFQYVFILKDGTTITNIVKSETSTINFNESINAEDWLTISDLDLLTDLENRVEVLEGLIVPQVQSDWNQTNNLLASFIKNKPTIPAAQVQSDWNAVSGLGVILNKPTLFSGAYADLSGKPTIPEKTSQLTNDSNFIVDANYVHTDNNLTDVLISTFTGKQDASTNLNSLSSLTYVSASFVKMTAAGTFALDTNTYALTNQSFYLGTTEIAINRASLAQTLSGITGLIPANDFVITLNGVSAITFKNTSAVANFLVYDRSSLLIGGATYNASYPLNINGNIRANGNLQLQSQGNITFGAAQILEVSTGQLVFKVGGSTTEFMRLNATGHLSVGGIFTSTAWVHLAAGTATAGTAPLKLSSGVNLTSAEVGAIEYDGTQLYFSPSTTRNILAQISGSTPLTNGYIPFATTSGYLTSDAGLFYDNTNKDFGIGTSTPASRLNVVKQWATTGASQIMATFDSYTDQPRFVLRRANGTIASPTAVLLNQSIANLSWRGHDGTSFGTQSLGTLAFFAAENFTTTNKGTYFTLYTTNIGAILATEKIRVIDTGWLGILNTAPLATLDVIGTVRFGDSTTNYSSFETDGTYVMTGNATVWDDIQFPISSGKVPVANFPSFETFTTNTEAFAFSVNDKIQLEANEPMHGWKEGTVGKAHIHFALKTAQSTGSNRYAKFELIFAYSDYNGIWTEQAAITQEATIPTGSAALQSFILAFTSTVTLTGLHVGSQITCRVRRIAATGGTEYADDVFITQVGVHVEMDTIGSRSDSAK